MADEQEAAEGSTAVCSSGSGVAGRCKASLQLYLALACLSVDAPASIESQLAARVQARGLLLAHGFPSRATRTSQGRYSYDARRALQAYRDAAVAGTAYWDHAYLFVALVHEVGPCTGMVLGLPFLFAGLWLLRTLHALLVFASGHPRQRFARDLQAAADCIRRGAVAELCFQCRTPCDPCSCVLPPQHAVSQCSRALPLSQLCPLRGSCRLSPL